MNDLVNFMRCAIAEAGGDRAPTPIKSSRSKRIVSQPASIAAATPRSAARECDSARLRRGAEPDAAPTASVDLQCAQVGA